MASIGFIGLGLMGRAMVGRLQDRGHDLVVLGNRDRTGVEAAVARGAREAHSAKEVATHSEIVMLCMGTSEQVEARMRGPEGVIAGIEGKDDDGRSASVVIDFGTSLPGSTQQLAGEVAALGAAYLDAPLGRTPAHAVDGLLNIMGAGDEAAFERVRPVLDDLGENVFHLGPSGSGHTIKLINNFFAMTTASAMSEAFAMADKAGIERQALFEVMGAGPLRSGMMEFIRNYAVDGQIDLAFSVANARKDVGYYGEMAEGMGAETIMSACAREVLSAAIEDGRGEDMVPQMVDFFAARFG